MFHFLLPVYFQDYTNEHLHAVWILILPCGSVQFEVRKGVEMGVMKHWAGGGRWVESRVFWVGVEGWGGRVGWEGGVGGWGGRVGWESGMGGWGGRVGWEGGVGGWHVGGRRAICGSDGSLSVLLFDSN